MSAQAGNQLRNEPPGNPFPGLRPFGEKDCDFFFGREDQKHNLLGRLRNLRFLAVLGNSGCGKSSLVRAGVLPALRDGFMSERPDGWKIAVMDSCNRPLAHLAFALSSPSVFGKGGADAALEESLLRAALARGNFALVDVMRKVRLPPDTKLLVVADQFEELFAYVGNPARPAALEEAHQFVRILLTAAGQKALPMYVILTMRSEFLGYCGAYNGLSEAINEGLYLVPRLAREEVRQAIEEPVKQCGGSISNGLVNRLLNDLGEEQDQLPVLQHALMRLWSLGLANSGQAPPNLDLDLYQDKRIDGLPNALSRHIEEIIDPLDQAEKRLTEIIFRNLTAVAENGELVSSPRTLKRLAEVANTDVNKIANVVEHFRGEGRSFLMPPPPKKLEGDTTIRLSHESLIRQWIQLRKWTLDEDRSRRIRKALKEATARWLEGGRNSAQEQDFLLQGLALEEALAWQNDHQEELNHESMAPERAFLERSEEGREIAARRAQQARDAWKWRTAAVVIGLLLLAVVAGLVAAVRSGSRARLARQKAVEANEKAIQEGELARQSARVADAERLANESIDKTGGLAIRSALLAAEAVRGSLVDEKGGNTGEPIRPNAKAALQRALSWLRPAGVQSLVIGSHSGPVSCVDASPDGRWLVTGSEDTTIRVWDLQAQPYSQNSSRELSGHGSGVTAVKLSPDNRWLIAGTASGAIFRREFRSGQPDSKGQLVGWIQDPVSEIQFAGAWFITRSPRGPVRAWKTEDLKQDLRLGGGFERISGLAAFTLPAAPDKSVDAWVAAAGQNKVLFWNLDGPDPVQAPYTLELGGRAWVRLLTVHPTRAGGQLFVGTDEGTDIICDLAALQAKPQPAVRPSQFPQAYERLFTNSSSLSYSQSARQVAFVDEQDFVIAMDYGGLLWGPSETNRLRSVNNYWMRPRFLRIAPEDPATTSRRWLVNIQDGGEMDLHTLLAGAPLPNPLRLRGHDGEITGGLFPGTRRDQFVSVGQDGLVRLWDFRLENSRPAQDAPAGSGNSEAVLSPGGKWLALLDSPTDAPWAVRLRPNPFAAEGPSLMLKPPPGAAGPARNSDQRSVPGLLDNSPQKFLAFAFDRQGVLQFLAAADAGTVYLWPIHDGTSVGEAEFLRGRLSGTKNAKADERSCQVVFLTTSPRGRWLAAGLRSGRACLWDLHGPSTNRASLLDIDTHKPVTGLSFSEDELRMASGGEDGVARVWELSGPEGKLVFQGVLPERAILDVNLSPKGDRLGVIGRQGSIRVWDLKTPQQPRLLKTLEPETESTGSMFSVEDEFRVGSQPRFRALLSPDGRWLVQLRNTQRPVLFDLDRPSEGERELEDQGASVTAFDFSPDSRWLVTLASDDSLTTWDLSSISPAASTLSPVCSQAGPLGSRSLVFDDQGFVYTTDPFGTVRRWPIAAPSLPSDWPALEGSLAFAIGRNLSQREWKYFFATAEPGSKQYRRTFSRLPDGPGVVSAQASQPKEDSDKNVQALQLLRDVGRIVETEEGTPESRMQQITNRLRQVRELGFGEIALEAEQDATERYAETLLVQALDFLQNEDFEAALKLLNLARQLAPAKRDWGRAGRALAETASDLEGPQESVAQIQQSVEELTGPTELVSLPPPSSVEALWSEARRLAAKGALAAAEQRLAQAQAAGLGMPWTPAEVVRQYYCYSEIRDVCDQVDRSKNEQDRIFNELTTRITNAKQGARFPSESVDEVVSQIVTNWRIGQIRFLLQDATHRLATVDAALTNLNIPTPAWLKGPSPVWLQASSFWPAARQRDLDAAFARYAEIKQAGLEWLLTATELNSLAWRAGTSGRASEVAAVADLAVKSMLDSPEARDTRGVVRALNGRVPESIADFEYFIICTEDTERRAQRQQWVKLMREGKAPAELFTPSLLESIKNQ